MHIKQKQSMNHPTTFRRIIMPALCLLFVGCALPPSSPDQRPEAAAERCLREARFPLRPAEQRAVAYLRAAELTAPLLGDASQPTAALRIYNEATAELVVLLRSEDGGLLWNRPLGITTDGIRYRLDLQPGDRQGVWSPDEFTAFKLASDVKETKVKSPDRRQGVGGALVGVRQTDPLEKFMPKNGMKAAVTATLDFSGHDATLSLNDPNRKSTTRAGGRERPLAADFSAPIAAFKHKDTRLLGIVEALRPGRFADDTGIYLLGPYDPQRIPVIFVHGLISTPYIWVDPINEINRDPVLRKRYQPLVFAYPSGYPLAYTALQFREQLAEFEKTHAMPNGFLLVAHSEGGLISQMQTSNLTREDWRRVEGAKADEFFARQTPGGEVERALVFKANPRAKRVVFIATPHRGSEMAESALGELAERLIRLPQSTVAQLKLALGNSDLLGTGNKHLLPTSVSGFAPDNPTLITMATTRVVPPCHSIVGNRGLPGPLAQSSDGVVPYWSSHLGYAKSEVVAPGPHSCYDYPQSIREMKRILHLHLGTLEN